jgi:hypothetical protein
MSRVFSSIVLTSPSGKIHVGSWRGNNIESEKKFARIEYPDVNGGSVQDLGLKIQDYPIDVWFSGEFHDIEARDFEFDWTEKGPWQVKHPVDGLLTLQPISISRDAQPVESGNATLCKTKWIKAGAPGEVGEFPLVDTSIASAAATATDKIFFDPDVQDTPIPPSDEISRFIRVTKSILGVTKKILKTTAFINNKYRAIISEKIDAVDNLLNQPFVTSNIVLSAINEILLIPATIVTTVASKIRLYKTLGDQYRAIEITLANYGEITEYLARDFDSLEVSVLSSMCLSTTVGDVLSREQAIEIASGIADERSLYIDHNDFIASHFDSRFSRDNYYGNIRGFEPMNNLVGATIGYVMDENYTQTVKKIVFIESTTATDYFAIENYPDLDPDESYQFFVDTNDLTGEEIVQLPTGKEVVVYV